MFLWIGPAGVRCRMFSIVISWPQTFHLQNQNYSKRTNYINPPRRFFLPPKQTTTIENQLHPRYEGPCASFYETTVPNCEETQLGTERMKNENNQFLFQRATTQPNLCLVTSSQAQIWSSPSFRWCSSLSESWLASMVVLFLASQPRLVPALSLVLP